MMIRVEPDGMVTNPISGEPDVGFVWEMPWHDADNPCGPWSLFVASDM